MLNKNIFEIRDNTKLKRENLIVNYDYLITELRKNVFKCNHKLYI